MTTTMRETIARALCAKSNRSWDSTTLASMEFGTLEDARNHWLGLADDAFDALESMIAEAYFVGWQDGSDPEIEAEGAYPYAKRVIEEAKSARAHTKEMGE